MPFRTQHSCMVDERVTNISQTRTKKTQWGTLELIYGTLPNGKLALRSIRIPGDVSIQVAQSLCVSRGGQFQPATPINAQKQLLSQMILLDKRSEREVFNGLYREIESFIKETECEECFR